MILNCGYTMTIECDNEECKGVVVEFTGKDYNHVHELVYASGWTCPDEVDELKDAWYCPLCSNRTSMPECIRNTMKNGDNNAAPDNL